MVMTTILPTSTMPSPASSVSCLCDMISVRLLQLYDLRNPAEMENGCNSKEDGKVLFTAAESGTAVGRGDIHSSRALCSLIRGRFDGSAIFRRTISRIG